MKAKVTFFLNGKDTYSFTRIAESKADAYRCIFYLTEALNMNYYLRESVQEEAITAVSQIFDGGTKLWQKSYFAIERIEEEEEED